MLIWDWRDEAARRSPVSLKVGKGYVKSAVFSRDPRGRYIVTASESSITETLEERQKQNVVRVWDWQTPQGMAEPVAVLGPFTSPVRSVSISNEDSRYVATLNDQGVRVHDWRTGEAWQDFSALSAVEAGYYSQVMFSPDGRYLAAVHQRVIEVWDWRSPEGRRQPLILRYAEAGFISVAFSPDSRLLVTTGNDLRAKVWDARTGLLLSIVGGRTEPYINRLEADASFGPDGRSIIATFEGIARIYSCPECGGGDGLLTLVNQHVTPQRRQAGYSGILRELSGREGRPVMAAGARRRRARK